MIIQTLAKLNYQPAVNHIAKFTDSEDSAIACAAIAAVCKLSGERTQIDRVVQFLQSENIHARRGVIQDLMDLQS